LNNKTAKTVIAYLFLLPALAVLGIFVFYPMLKGIYLGFCSYPMIKCDDLGNPLPPAWIGWDNFKRLTRDPYFYIALKNSFIYLLVVPVIQILSLMMAWLLNQKLRGKIWFRVAYFIPVITSIVIVGVAWKWVFASNGILNFFLVQKLHLFAQAPGWLTDKHLALFSVMFVTLWQGLGYYMILYLAGLQSIAPEFEEAARIDGAGWREVFFRVVLPLLKPSIALCTIISCISAFKVFGEIYVMTEGGPENGTLTLVYYIFTKAFYEFELGYACALALVLGLLVAAISAVNLKFFKEGGLSYY
jgi:putative chitobiose transport system permease protein